MTQRKLKQKPTQTTHAVTEQNDILEREKKALALKKMCLSYRAIGEQLGVSHTQARHDVENALSHIRDNVTADAVKLRDLEVARLDDLYIKLQEKLQSQSERVWDRAYNKALSIIELRAKLQGLFAPVQIETVTYETKMIDAIRAREFDYATVLGIVDNDTSLAAKLFAEAGVPIER